MGISWRSKITWLLPDNSSKEDKIDRHVWLITKIIESHVWVEDLQGYILYQPRRHTCQDIIFCSFVFSKEYYKNNNSNDNNNGDNVIVITIMVIIIIIIIIIK